MTEEPFDPKGIVRRHLPVDRLPAITDGGMRARTRMRLMKPEFGPAQVRKVLNSGLVGPVAYGAAAGLSVLSPVLAIIICVLVPVGYLVEAPVGAIGSSYLVWGS